MKPGSLMVDGARNLYYLNMCIKYTSCYSFFDRFDRVPRAKSCTVRVAVSTSTFVSLKTPK